MQTAVGWGAEEGAAPRLGNSSLACPANVESAAALRYRDDNTLLLPGTVVKGVGTAATTAVRCVVVLPVMRARLADAATEGRRDGVILTAAMVLLLPASAASLRWGGLGCKHGAYTPLAAGGALPGRCSGWAGALGYPAKTAAIPAATTSAGADRCRQGCALGVSRNWACRGAACQLLGAPPIQRGYLQGGRLRWRGGHGRGLGM
jgi:hypothetical protein